MSLDEGSSSSSRSHRGDLLIIGDEDLTEGGALQSNFRDFLREKRRKYREKLQQMENELDPARRDPDRMRELREKFVDTALSYRGVPYAAKYHPPDSPEANSPIFLDCCGLIRQVVFDLREEFGFSLLQYNQNYQFDTLRCDQVSSIDELEPGDLIFYRAQYYHPERFMNQAHGLVHVEMYYGEGRTIGARWARGTVGIFDSYQFESKNYHSVEHLFVKIDSWLKGICRNWNPNKEWKDKSSLVNPSSRSIFTWEDSEDEGRDYLDPHDDDINEDVQVEDLSESSFQNDSSIITSCSKTVPVEKIVSPNRKTKKGSNSRNRHFYVSEGNNWKLVASLLEDMGWTQIPFDCITDPKCSLFWTELRMKSIFQRAREGVHLVNHIPNNHIITRKSSLLETLRTFCNKKGSSVDLFQIVPETYQLHVAWEALRFFERSRDGDAIWITKPLASNQGRGIQLLRDVKPLREAYLGTDQVEFSLGSGSCDIPPDSEYKRDVPRKRAALHRARDLPKRLVQLYIDRPLLIKGRKFDARMYLLIASCRPHFCVYFAPGFLRLAASSYDRESEDLTAHLTNMAIQKKHPEYMSMKDELVMSLEEWAAYVTEDSSEEDSFPRRDWILKDFVEETSQIARTVFLASKSKLERKRGYFDLLGLDFFVDESLHVWLLEVNTNPSLQMAGRHVLEDRTPRVVKETLSIVLSIHESGHVPTSEELDVFDLIYDDAQ